MKNLLCLLEGGFEFPLEIFQEIVRAAANDFLEILPHAF